MDSYEQFDQCVKKAADFFKSIDKKEVIRLISHLDADGISSCALAIKLLNNENMKYSVSTVQQLNRQSIEQIAKEPYNYIIFTDLGSSAVEDIRELIPEKKVIILDHHTIKGYVQQENIVMVNPHLYGIDGGKEISGAGVVFKFAAAVDESMKEYAHLAIIGALGDLQDQNGFLKLNQEILKIAVEKNKINVKKGLRIFGAQTKPLHKALEYCTDPYIPGVSGTESGAIQFLCQIGIDPKNGSGWKKIAQLNDEEMQKLVTGIIMKRLNESNPEDVLGDIYILPHEQDESPTKDAKEFATLLNACGRLGRASFGIGACLGDKKIKQQAIRSLTDYKKEIVNALAWYNENKHNEDIHWGAKYVIINAKNSVMSTIIGTLASILSKSNLMTNNQFILSMARNENGMTKASLRSTISNGNAQKSFDLKKVVDDISSKISSCECGGHMNAAGAVFPTESEQFFIQSAKEVLEKYVIEESIN